MLITVQPRPWLGTAHRGVQSVFHCCRAASTVSNTTSRIQRPPGPAPKNRDYLNITADALSRHWETTPPSREQLKYAQKFFNARPPTFLWSAPKFARMNFGDSPEVCFLGRSNVGKSSLLNAILGRRAMAHVSSKPGRTQSMNAFAVGGEEDNGKNRLVVLDMPGYGKGGRAEWGKEILKYLVQRKQMKRAFLLIDSEHGVKSTDEQLLALFRRDDIPHQVIMSKVDKVLFTKARTPGPEALQFRLAELRRTMEETYNTVQPGIEDGHAAVGEIIACSSEKILEGQRLGIDAVRHAMLQAAELELREKVKPVAAVDIVPHEEIWQTG